MARRYLIPLAAAFGLAFAIFTVVQGNQSAHVAPPLIASPAAPFSSYVVGTGLTEAITGNIAIGTPVSGIVTAIYVKWDESVAIGGPLFKIDDREAQGKLLTALAKAKEVEARLDKTTNRLKVAEGLQAGTTISAVDLENRRYDVAIEKAALASANAQVEQLRIEIERHTVKALVAGRILQINTRLGEFAQSGTLTNPLMLLGDTTRLSLRVNIDENDAWRIHAQAPAVGFVRGNPSLKTRLKFERFEPYIIPKASLTGQSTERTDMRVLQVIYSFDRAEMPIYVGQQMDAFIETPPVVEGQADVTKIR